MSHSVDGCTLHKMIVKILPPLTSRSELPMKGNYIRVGPDIKLEISVWALRYRYCSPMTMKALKCKPSAQYTSVVSMYCSIRILVNSLEVHDHLNSLYSWIVHIII